MLKGQPACCEALKLGPGRMNVPSYTLDTFGLASLIQWLSLHYLINPSKTKPHLTTQFVPTLISIADPSSGLMGFKQQPHYKQLPGVSNSHISLNHRGRILTVTISVGASRIITREKMVAVLREPLKSYSHQLQPTPTPVPLILSASSAPPLI
jgi:hypothetical protein